MVLRQDRMLPRRAHFRLPACATVDIQEINAHPTTWHTIAFTLKTENRCTHEWPPLGARRTRESSAGLSRADCADSA